jgi:hypothetical protein
MADITKKIYILYTHRRDVTTIDVSIVYGCENHVMSIDIAPIDDLERSSVRGAFSVTASLNNGQRVNARTMIRTENDQIQSIDLGTTNDLWYPPLPQSMVDFINEHTT